MRGVVCAMVRLRLLRRPPSIGRTMAGRTPPNLEGAVFPKQHHAQPRALTHVRVVMSVPIVVSSYWCSTHHDFSQTATILTEKPYKAQVTNATLFFSTIMAFKRFGFFTPTWNYAETNLFSNKHKLSIRRMAWEQGGWDVKQIHKGIWTTYQKAKLTLNPKP